MIAQDLSVEAEDMPLSELLVKLRSEHNLKFSFDDQLLSKFSISVDQSFKNPEEAVRFLIKDLPLRVELVDDVYLIVPRKIRKPRLISKISGQIRDSLSGEPLPYSHLTVNGQRQISDGQGRFSYHSGDIEQEFHVQVTYLGYYILDTLLSDGSGHIIDMHPSIIGLQEVIIADKGLPFSSMSKHNPGEIRLNHQIGSFLPGFADNSVYNLLRLQPGVLAAGEQANDLVIWGSYPGQSAILFDGYTLFGLKNFNDNIGVVNPFMVKDIRLMKGAFPANYGGKTGGIVDITGQNGNINKPEFQLTATNMILNARLSVPISERSALSVAFRQTYYNLIDADDLNLFPNSRENLSKYVDLKVSPLYMFRDINLKYAGQTKNGDSYYLNLLNGIDRYSYSADFNNGNRRIENTSSEQNHQMGGSLFYGKKWVNGNTSNILLTSSSLVQQKDNKTIISTPLSNEQKHNWRDEQIKNQINQSAINIDNSIALSQNNSLEAGIGMIHYNIELREDSVGENKLLENEQIFGLSSFAQDKLSINDRLNVLLGLRLDFPLKLGRVLIQPRMSMNYQMAEKWWLKAGLGRYYQYVVESSILDEEGNYQYFWTVSNGEDIPVQSANHVSAGINYQGSWFSAGAEAYYKKLEGLTRYIYRPNRIERDIYLGEGKSMGVDFLLEAKYRKHSAWLGYSLSACLERFSAFPISTYVRAPQDQRHEIKGAAMFNFDPFYFSTNYVYGSGFASRGNFQSGRDITDLAYSRLDISFVYRFNTKKLDLEAGVSILNVLNHENLKFDNIIRIPNMQSGTVNIHAEAVPFTPTIFLKIGL